MLRTKTARSICALVSFAAILSCANVEPSTQDTAALAYVGDANNDLFHALRQNGLNVSRFASAAEAVSAAAHGAAVILVSDGYPRRRTEISAATVREAQTKDVRIYIEYPARLPSGAVGRTLRTTHERVVITSTEFGEALRPMDLLGLNDAHVLRTSALTPLAVVANVAGMDRAVYGIDDVPSVPLLFRDQNMMIATTKLSDHASARFAPSDRWTALWSHILLWLTRENHTLVLTSRVTPTYAEDERRG